MIFRLDTWDWNSKIRWGFPLLRSPVNLDTLRRLEAAGASVAVLPSLFEEQIRHEEQELQRLYEYQAESYAESLTLFSRIGRLQHRPK